MTAQTMQIGSRPCRIYGRVNAEYILLQMTGEHELQSMESEVAAIAQGAHHFLFAAIPVENWNDALSPWEAPAVWGKQGFGGKAADTLCFLTEQVVPTLKQQFHLPENVKIILGGYSLAGLFALYALYQTDVFARAASMSGSFWFEGIMEYVCSHEMKRKPDCLYFSLGDKESSTDNPILNVVQQNTQEIETLCHGKGIETTFVLNSGSHYQACNKRTAAGIHWILNR